MLSWGVRVTTAEHLQAADGYDERRLVGTVCLQQHLVVLGVEFKGSLGTCDE